MSLTGGLRNIPTFGSPFSTGGGIDLNLPTSPTAPSSSREVGGFDRFDLNDQINPIAQSPVGRLTGFNKFVDEASQKGVEGFGALFGTLPARVAETPFSLADTASKRAGIDFGQTPLGNVLGAAGEAVNRISNFIPAIINSRDAELFKAVGDLPDNTPITDALVRQREHIEDRGILNALTDFGKGTGGGLFGIGNRPMTVGELKAELAKRGFFRDGEGNPVDPQQLLGTLRSGKSSFDFGDRSINDNPLVDLAGRMALDPTNALFLVPGGAMAKVGLAGLRGSEGLKAIETVGRVLPRGRLVEAGAVAARLPRPIQAAEAIANGDMKLGTLKGLGELLKGGATSAARLGEATIKQALDPRNYLRAEEGTTGVARLLSRGRSYQKSSLALGATNIAVNRLTGLVNDSLGGNVPVLSWINDFTSDVENDRPLSENSAWMLASAMAFPYGEIVGGAAKKVGQEKVRLVGRNEIDDLIRAAGSHEKLLTQLGGDPGLQNLLYFLDKQDVRKRLGDDVINNIVGAQSIPDLATRLDVTEKALQNIVDQYRADGKFSGKTRMHELQEWARNQGGFSEGVDFTPSWDDIVRRWKQFEPVQQFIGPELRAHGQFISGLRDDVLFTKQVDSTLAYLESAVKDGVVPKDAIKRALSDTPALNKLDRLGFWEKYALPDQPAPTIRQVRDALKRQRDEAVPFEEYFADANAHEKEAPGPLPDPSELFETRTQKIDRLRAELAGTVDENGTILPDQVERSQAIQRQLETELAAQNEIAWVKRGEDEQKAGVDPAESRRLQAEASEALGAPGEFPADADSHSPEMKAWQDSLDRQVALIDPSYTVKYAPTREVIAALRPDDPDFIRGVDTRTALGAWLHHDGVFSKLAAFSDSLFGPQRQSDRYRAAKQALYNEFIPLGAKSKDVDAWLAKLNDVVAAHTHEFGGQKIELIRGVHAVPANTLIRLAKESLPASVLAKLDDKGILNRFDRAGSSFWRSAKQGAREGNKFSQVLERFYRVQQNAPLSGTRRLVGRTLYPLFRFMLDPRWIMLNAVEAEFIGAGRDGILPKDAKGPLGTAAQHFLAEGQKIGDMQVVPDAGWLFGKRYAQYVAKSWEKRSLDTVESALNAIGDQAPELVALKQAIRREADFDLANGTIDAATHKKRIAASNREIGEYINDFLYRTDKRGIKGAVDKTIDEAASDWLTREEREVMAPLLTKIAERNVELWQDVKHMYTGNPDRSTAERVLNSYWLYWPLSYQVKATKWLADIMLNGSFGHDNGALLAGKYALWQQQHTQQMKDNPQYAAMFNQNRTLWFLAQMVLPITPNDIGVSLSRPTRAIGASVQGGVNDMLGTRIGAFTAYKQLQDGLIPTIQWITDLGPLYSQELLNRVGTELEGVPVLGASTNEQSTEPFVLPRSAPPTIPQLQLPNVSPVNP